VIPAEGAVIEVVPDKARDHRRHHHRHQEDGDQDFFVTRIVEQDGQQHAEPDLEQQAHGAILDQQHPAILKLAVPAEPGPVFEVVPDIAGGADIDLVEAHIDEPEKRVDGDAGEDDDGRQQQIEIVAFGGGRVQRRRRIANRARTILHGEAGSVTDPQPLAG